MRRNSLELVILYSSISLGLIGIGTFLSKFSQNKS
jgi:hypothetical protein